MAVDQDALDLFQPQIDVLAERCERLTEQVAQLEARPSGGSTLTDEALLDLLARLYPMLNAESTDAARAAIVERATNAL